MWHIKLETEEEIRTIRADNKAQVLTKLAGILPDNPKGNFRVVVSHRVPPVPPQAKKQ